jgi:acetoin utilization protein AcuB
MKDTLVQDVMTRDPITIGSNTTLPDAYWTMINNRIRRLLVVDQGKLQGIVTLEDLRQKIPFTTFAIDPVRASETLANFPIRQVMATDLKTITPDTPLVEAAKLMLENKISTLPVMRDEQLAGIITEGDIFRAFVQLCEDS